MNQECYTGVHMDLFLPLGLSFAILVCLLPPILSIIVVVHHRRKLSAPHIAQMWGFLFHKYR